MSWLLAREGLCVPGWAHTRGAQNEAEAPEEEEMQTEELNRLIGVAPLQARHSTSATGSHATVAARGVFVLPLRGSDL